MPFIKRNEDGSISSLTQVADEEHQEHIQATSSEIIEFLSETNESDHSKIALAESDRDLARVTEDLINLLISKNLILFTELPEPVQYKLLNRERMRTSFIENFLDDDDGI